MCHAQIGWRDPAKSIRAFREIWETCDKAGHRVDRYGLCLDWSMAMPRAIREKAQRGTGMILRDPRTSWHWPMLHRSPRISATSSLASRRRWRTRNGGACSGGDDDREPRSVLHVPGAGA